VKVLWLPGNHDAHTFFSNETYTKLGDENDIASLYEGEGARSCINMHGHSILLEKDLLLVGMGGSTNTFFLPNDSTELRYMYDGYPLNEYSSYEQMLSQIWAKTAEPWLEKRSETTNGQILLMTHDGPYDFLTTKHAGNDKETNPTEGTHYFGSPA
jgi:hypothetical protein